MISDFYLHRDPAAF